MLGEIGHIHWTKVESSGTDVYDLMSHSNSTHTKKKHVYTRPSINIDTRYSTKKIFS